MNTADVLIAIQARSTSTRLPKKIFEKIGHKRVLDHVIAQAQSAANHINRHTSKIKINCQVAVLYPDNDLELLNAFKHSGAIMIGGSEDDVLSRYVAAQRLTNANYVVRLTSDCPIILDFIIAKHIHTAAFRSLDYVSNVDEACRFVADGLDVEVLSEAALDWLDKTATLPDDREHVTTLLRRARPCHLRQGLVTMKLDTSHMKMSVDTLEDLERVREYFHRREAKMTVARNLFGDDIYEL
jgi:spore coat polysaccharide biosynthesis protein SpsF (cytidylyltransferase family)